MHKYVMTMGKYHQIDWAEEKIHISVLERIAMINEHTKSSESPICGCSVAQQVHLVSLLRVLAL